MLILKLQQKTCSDVMNVAIELHDSVKGSSMKLNQRIDRRPRWAAYQFSELNSCMKISLLLSNENSYVSKFYELPTLKGNIKTYNFSLDSSNEKLKLYNFIELHSSFYYATISRQV